MHMTDWPDEKIYNNVIWEIRRNLMTPDQWAFTRIAGHHKEIADRLDSTTGERLVVTALTAGSNWYAMTTRRVVGQYNGDRFNPAYHHF